MVLHSRLISMPSSWDMFMQLNQLHYISNLNWMQAIEKFNLDVAAALRRIINGIKAPEVPHRKAALLELHKMLLEQSLTPAVFDQIAQMTLKDILKCCSDVGETCREYAVNILIDMLPKCKRLSPLLPYVFSVIVDRTNCIDLDGIDNVPEKMRPAPGQKPKVMVKLVENCEEIRILYCELMKKLITLLTEDELEVRKHLDDMVSILRTLIMDPCPTVQKNSCDLLQFFCNSFKNLLLHYTELLGRAVLLPLVSKKSKIRISALNALTSIFWCGLWKYNAFVFENLIGFRDPNSVPIKDFFEPSHNINYLATFINDGHVKVRQQFMRHLKIWICDLDDRYDHHGKLVPYLLSGLFDHDELVKTTSLEAIAEIGAQIEVEREKEFRENKQFAIDAKWTWEGLLVDLPLPEPLAKRAGIGSRFFVRGHVRKFWTALYKEIKDIHFDNRIRAAKLMTLGSVYTENYLTQYLDNMIPQLLTTILPVSEEDKPISDRIAMIFQYVGRYCEQSAYLHIIKSCLKGEYVENEEFLRATFKGLSKLIEGNFEAIPENTGLQHKQKEVSDLLSMLQECEIETEIFNYNCKEAKAITFAILDGLRAKAKRDQLHQLMVEHYLTLLKMVTVSYYQEAYLTCSTLKNSQILEQPSIDPPSRMCDHLHQLYPAGLEEIEAYLNEQYMSNPCVMDSNWKTTITLYHYFGLQSEEHHAKLLLLAQEVISETLKQNRAVQLLSFVLKFCLYVLRVSKGKLWQSNVLLERALENLNKFKPIKKIPVYDQQLMKEENDPTIIKVSEEMFKNLFSLGSQVIREFYARKDQAEVPIRNLAAFLTVYFKVLNKLKRDKNISEDAIRTVWAVFERVPLTVEFPQKFCVAVEGQEKPMLPLVVDFVIERLQMIGEEYQHFQIKMLFGVLEQLLKCWSPDLATNQLPKLPYIYPEFPQLLQKLFKYALDEKDLETRNEYHTYLAKLCRKMKKWFECELSMAQKGHRYAKANLITDIIEASEKIRHD